MAMALDDPARRAAKLHQRAVETHERAAELHEAAARVLEEHAEEMAGAGKHEAAQRSIMVAARERALAFESKYRADDERAFARTEDQRPPLARD